MTIVVVPSDGAGGAGYGPYIIGHDDASTVEPDSSGSEGNGMYIGIVKPTQRESRNPSRNI